jgi:hypothetical protein
MARVQSRHPISWDIDMNTMRTPLTALVAAISMHAGSIAAADDIKFGEETFELSGGAFFQNFDTTIQVKDNEGSGDNIGLEDTLGYDDNNTSGLINASWRIASRHRLELSYFDSDRDVSEIATEDIYIGDGEVIPAGAGYDSKLEMKVIPFKYSYSFVKSDNSELYGSVGLHWYSIDYTVEGVAGLGENEWTGDIDAKADAPMPLIGGGYDYYINDRWKVGLGAQAFYIKFGGSTDFEGSLLNFNVGTEYFVFNNVGIGAAVSYFKLDVDVDDSDWRGKLDYEAWGPQVYLKARF